MEKIVLSILLFSMLLVGCSKNSVNTDNLVVSINESTKFTEDEIKEVIEVVKKEQMTYPEADLLSLMYDDSLLELNSIYKAIAVHAEVSLDDIIIITSDFNIGDHKLSPSESDGLEPNSEHRGYKYYLIRDNKGKWKIVDRGVI